MPVSIDKIEIKEYQNLKNINIYGLGPLTVFVGQNNSGKTRLLNWIYLNHQDIANYVSMDEIVFLFNDKVIGEDQFVLELRKRAFENLIMKLKASKERNAIFNYFYLLTSIRIDFIYNDKEAYFLVEDRESSKMKRKDIKKLGSAFVAILASLVDMLWNSNPVILVDEPETSLHASLQKKLFAVLKDIAYKDGKQVFIASHSHLFLDKENPRNNFKISLYSGKKVIHQLKTYTDIVVAVYQLLGNTPNDLLMPNNFIIVEGPSDKIFLVHLMQRFFAKELENKHIIVQPAHGDLVNKQITTTMHYVDDFFAVLNGNPLYRDRVVVLVDEEPAEVLHEFRHKYQFDEKRFFTLGDYGYHCLEYAYPEEVLYRVAKKIKNPYFKRKDVENLRKSILLNKHNKKVIWADEVGKEIKKEEVPEVFMKVIKTAIEYAY